MPETAPSDLVAGDGVCRVRLVTDGLRLEFRATLEQARNFAEAVRRWPSPLRVTIDGDNDPALPWLPCRTLWER